MSLQLDMFGTRPKPQKRRRCRVYQETSRLAFDKAKEPRRPKPGSVNDRILRVIGEAGPAGITCEDIEQKTGVNHSHVSGNLAHLVNDDSLVARRLDGKGGYLKAPMRNGNPAHLHVLTARARALGYGGG